MAEQQFTFNDGDAYERVIGRWSTLVADTFLEWLAQPQKVRWLDVGCGSGAFTEQVLIRCSPSDIHGMDPSSEQLDYARRRLGSHGARFQTGDAQAIPFDEASFDVAAMALVISFVPDQAKGVAEMRRVVRPGGCVAAYMWDIRGGGVPTEPTLAAMRSLGISYPDLGDPSLDYLRGLWEQAGLSEIETRVIRIPVRFSSFEDYWEVNTIPGGPMHARIAKLAPEERDRLRTRTGELIPRDGDGRIGYLAHANAVKGTVPESTPLGAEDEKHSPRPSTRPICG